jgi:hypothetical protein
MSRSAITTTLPHWAFVAIGQSDINVLMDRCEFETIIVTRQGRPDLVMVGHAEWLRLTQSAVSRVRSEPTSTTRKEDTGHASPE